MINCYLLACQGFVLLEGDGSVSSVVAGGANAAWTTDKASAALGALKGAAVVMLQREVPEDVNVLFANAAKRDGIPVLLDAGGEDSPLGNSLLQNVDFLCPNEGELGRLTGLSTSTEHLVVTAARSLQSRGAKNVLVTLGERGSLLLSSDGSVLRQGPMPLPGGRVVDATGAGDAYRAAFAVALVEGRPLAECMAFGAAAGAVAVTRAGAVPSLPWRSECELLLASEQPLQPLSASGIANSSLPSCRTGDGSQQGYCEAEEHKLRFASRLNSMKARQDLAKGGGDDLLGMVARHGNIQGVDAVFFNYPQHLKGHEQESVRRALDEAGLAAGAVCIRFPDSMGQGAFTNPEDSVRKEAVKLAVEGCQWARQLGAEELVVWPQTDGYDYHLQVRYSWRSASNAAQRQG